VRTIAFPFRIASDGTVASVEHGSNEEAAQLLVALVMTHRGEMPLSPQFGLDDPAFGATEPGEVASAVSVYYPHISLNDIRVTDPTNDGRSTIEVDFDAES
jgi:phage baseplate assembly protein W